MRGIFKIVARRLGRLAMGNPERLWVHYCIALLFILCMLIATHTLNRVVIDRGTIMSEGVKRVSAQQLIAQNILFQSKHLATEPTADFTVFNKAIVQFEENYRSLIAKDIRSPELFDHYFSEDTLLHVLIRTYIALATEFALVPEAMREKAMLRVAEHYNAGGLEKGLSAGYVIFTEQVKTETEDLIRIQYFVMGASVLILLAEAVLIFMPAQFTVTSTIQAMRTQTKELREYQAQLEDMNSKLAHMIHHDQLTGLPNRTSLTQYLSAAIADKQASEFNLLFIGLDAFKSVNDTMGHDYGDALLVEVSDALQNCVDQESMVARVGGDEFIMVTDEPSSMLVKRVFASLVEPFEVKGRRVPINASIGHLKITNVHAQPLDIVADAEIALQFAKNEGGARAQAFTDDLRSDLDLMQRLQLDLSDAIKNGEIEPWFQPQVRLADGRLHGAEVLARWRHPTRGLLTPNVFLPAAERARLMVDLDHALWETAMQLAQGWQTESLWRPSISLNASPDTIADPHLIERFLLNLQRSGLETDQVIVEVLETTLIDGHDDMAAINIDSLAECGIALELDDFGTGYASLSKLTQLPLTGIKLDRSLVAPLPDQTADSVVRAILALATELGLHVVAEGVEESEQADHLTHCGCGIGQGYGFGRPMPPQEFTAWLATHANSALRVGPDDAALATRA